MKVLLIGKTEADLFPAQGNGRHRMPGKAGDSDFSQRVATDSLTRHDFEKESGQELIEYAGRLCYESFDLPNEDTKTNSAYVQNIISLGHESVLEHVSVTFYVEGVSRNLSHELIRHRHLSFSELSQRYVNMTKANVVTPPAFRSKHTPDVIPMPKSHKEQYEASVVDLKGEGKTHKQAREAARYGLPQGTETKFVVSGNLRAWRDVLKKRHSKFADAEMQIFAAEVLSILSGEYPDVFMDIEYDEG